MQKYVFAISLDKPSTYFIYTKVSVQDLRKGLGHEPAATDNIQGQLLDQALGVGLQSRPLRSDQLERGEIFTGVEDTSL